ncbi:MAG: M67 family metallopeptidase [Longimicrobiales bacterium]
MIRHATLAARPLDALCADAAARYPEEACGLLLGQVAATELSITRAVACPNTAPAEQRRRSFEIDPRAVLNLRRELRGTATAHVGFYHSHPDAEARPSERDLPYLLLWPETLWLIVPVEAGASGAARAWWVAGKAAGAEPIEVELRLLSQAQTPCADRTGAR